MNWKKKLNEALDDGHPLSTDGLVGASIKRVEEESNGK